MKEKLLVLDDEPLILSSLDHLFEDDYEVFTTTDAETALRLALDNDMAVILCDERMPGVNGHEFLRLVREVSRATRVMMSGYADMSALTEAVNTWNVAVETPAATVTLVGTLAALWLLPMSARLSGKLAGIVPTVLPLAYTVIWLPSST